MSERADRIADHVLRDAGLSDHGFRRSIARSTRGDRGDLRAASKRVRFPTPVPSEAARCQRTRVSGRIIVMALRTDGNHRYSWTKTSDRHCELDATAHHRCSTIS